LVRLSLARSSGLPVKGIMRNPMICLLLSS
jgi:hypothetical protein